MNNSSIQLGEPVQDVVKTRQHCGQRPLMLSPEPDAHDCKDDTAPTKACFAPLVSPFWAALLRLLMLLKALLTADLESVLFATESAAFLNSDTHVSLQATHASVSCSAFCINA